MNHPSIYTNTSPCVSLSVLLVRTSPYVARNGLQERLLFTRVPLPVSPSLSRSQTFSLVAVFFWRRGSRGESSSRTLLWEESRFFWHQWAGGRDGGGAVGHEEAYRAQTAPLMAVFCSTLQSCVLQQAYTCSHSRLDSHIYYLWDTFHMGSHVRIGSTIALDFYRKRSKC